MTLYPTPTEPRRRAERGQPAISKALTDIDPTRRSAVQDRASQIPRLYRARYLRVAAGNGSPREAIAAQCLECVCWLREEVRLCTATACPLYRYRPWQGGDDE
jgi:hypothetical protein